MLQIIDYFFIPFHSILKLFNAFGWKVRELLGYDDRINSYIHFLILK